MPKVGRPRAPAPAELPVPERREKAYAAALRLLASRERSAVEIASRLREKGFDPETVVVVLDRLRSSGFQDDRRFAEDFAGSAIRSKGMSGRAVQSELRRRGIEKETAAQVATRSPEEELETALGLARKKERTMAGLGAEVRLRRIAGLLQRRGYDRDTVSAVLSRLGETQPGMGETRLP
jgi:regulatory protein